MIFGHQIVLPKQRLDKLNVNESETRALNFSFQALWFKNEDRVLGKDWEHGWVLQGPEWELHRTKGTKRGEIFLCSNFFYLQTLEAAWCMWHSAAFSLQMLCSWYFLFLCPKPSDAVGWNCFTKAPLTYPKMFHLNILRSSQTLFSRDPGFWWQELTVF